MFLPYARSARQRFVISSQMPRHCDWSRRLRACRGWDRERVSVLGCLWVVLNEKIEHHRLAERDLDLVAAEPRVVSVPPAE